MAYFAEVDNGFVINIIVADQSFIDTLPNKSDFHEYLMPPCEAGKTAGIGYIYDQTLNVYYPPQPYPSWKLNTTTWQWEPPVPYPDDGGYYIWDESSESWVLYTNPPNA